MKQHRIKRLAALVIVAVAGMGMAACSSQSTPANTSTSGAASSNPIFDMLPPEVQKSGKLVVATDPQFGPPTNFHPASDPNGWAGVEPDLLRALEPVLGIKFEWQQATFESIIPGVKSGRYDLGVNSLSITKEREEQTDMIAWWSGVNVVIANAGNPKNITKLQDLCGQPMAIVQGSADQAYLTTWSQTNCNGKPIDLQPFKDRPACLLALDTNRVVATAGGTGFSINLAHNLDGNQGDAAKKYAVLTEVNYFPTPAGIAVQKGRDALSKALMAAIQKVMDDGTYTKIFDKWYWPQAGRLTAPALNPAV